MSEKGDTKKEDVEHDLSRLRKKIKSLEANEESQNKRLAELEARVAQLEAAPRTTPAPLSQAADDAPRPSSETAAMSPGSAPWSWTDGPASFIAANPADIVLDEHGRLMAPAGCQYACRYNTPPGGETFLFNPEGRALLKANASGQGVRVFLPGESYVLSVQSQANQKMGFGSVSLKIEGTVFNLKGTGGASKPTATLSFGMSLGFTGKSVAAPTCSYMGTPFTFSTTQQTGAFNGADTTFTTIPQKSAEKKKDKTKKEDAPPERVLFEIVESQPVIVKGYTLKIGSEPIDLLFVFGLAYGLEHLTQQRRPKPMVTTTS